MNTTSPSHKPVVSVIIPTFNCASIFESCLKSVFDQHLVEKEIVVVDGGSTDGTLDLIKKYDNQITKWISEPDKGIYDALNKGIDLADGEWLYFLGSDDRLYDGQVLADIPFAKTQSKMIYGNVVLKNDGVVGPAGAVYDGRFDKYKLAQKNICHQAIFYKRELFQELGKYDERYPMLADWVFNMRAFASKNTNPTFINRDIALYANQGMSDRGKDIKFKQDRDSLIKRYLGLKVYFGLKFSRSKVFRIGTQLFR